jgi:DnaJ family protein C protein 1
MMRGNRIFLVVAAAAMAVLVFPEGARAWDEEELEIFDLVEEMNRNFYEYMEIPPDAGSSEIRKAYRRLSLVLHPDKNSAEDAEVKFRWLVATYEILKDEKKRAIYDRVLVEGLPDWRMPIYYYRRMRKMGLAEGLAYLVAIVTVCQYFVNWAAYWERSFTLREAVNAHVKKQMKKGGKKAQKADDLSAAIEDEEEKILGPKPTMFDLLPFQLFRLTKFVVVSLPSLPSTLMAAYASQKAKQQEEEDKKREEEEERQRKEEEKKEKKERAKQRKQVGSTFG